MWRALIILLITRRSSTFESITGDGGEMSISFRKGREGVGAIKWQIGK